MEETQEKKKRRKLHEISLEQDIKYRGPLSYRYLKIAGWVCIAASQIFVLISFFNNIRPGSVVLPIAVTWILVLVSSLPVPLFLLANFSLILDSDKGYKRLLLANGLAAGGIAVVFILLYLRYGIGIAGLLLGDKSAAISALDQIFSSLTASGKAFNVFLDFFLCTLFMFFLNYRPLHFFTGKKILLFRAFALFPVFYEIASLVIKFLAARKLFILPVILFPFLTVKAPLLFIVFVVLAFFIKNRERRFCRNGRTHQEYTVFLKTNRNSWHFSVFTAIVFLIAGLIDLILFFVLLSIQANGSGQGGEIINSLGFGSGSIGLILLAPFVLLFSYTRRHKSILPDIVIPIAGMVLVVLVYLEGIFQALKTLLGG